VKIFFVGFPPTNGMAIASSVIEISASSSCRRSSVAWERGEEQRSRVGLLTNAKVARDSRIQSVVRLKLHLYARPNENPPPCTIRLAPPEAGPVLGLITVHADPNWNCRAGPLSRTPPALMYTVERHDVLSHALIVQVNAESDTNIAPDVKEPDTAEHEKSQV